jgi:hypothetical protein
VIIVDVIIMAVTEYEVVSAVLITGDSKYISFGNVEA